MARSSSWLFVIASAPYQHGLDSDPAVDITMAAGAFGQKVSVLFIGEGLGYLDPAVVPNDGESDLRKLLKSLPLYDVEDVFIMAEGDEEKMRSFSIPAERATADRASQLIADADHVVSF